MKVKVLSRNPDDYIRETKLDVHRVPRNYDPTLHPFEVCREYTQALNATKLERVFAKPFIGSLDGHRDGVNCLAKHTKSLSTLLSGSCDGEVKVWNLTKRECVRTLQAHEGFVRGLVVRFCGTSFFSVGDDKTVKQWKMEAPGYGEQEEPVNTILGKTVFTGLDHHQTNGMFATCGQQVDIWDEQRSSPIRSFTWGVDSFSSVRFNPVETRLIPVPAPAHNRTSNPGVCAPASEVWRVSTSPVTLYHGPVTELLASCASDRSIVLYDMRESAPLKKVIMTMRSNTLCWNPMEAYYFTSSNEDYNLYTYDMRYLKEPVTMHMDHVSAVLDVDYSPTGREFVTASFDKTIRIFAKDQTHSREVYHTKRMQHVICVKWSADNKYILSGSDEMNIRIWKANAAEKLGVMLHRERASANYNQRLKEKFQHHPKIKRIAQHRHLPKSVYQEARQQKIMRQASSRKERNVRKHSKPGSVPVRSEKQKHVVAEVK